MAVGITKRECTGRNDAHYDYEIKSVLCIQNKLPCPPLRPPHPLLQGRALPDGKGVLTK